MHDGSDVPHPPAAQRRRLIRVEQTGVLGLAAGEADLAEEIPRRLGARGDAETSRQQNDET